MEQVDISADDHVMGLLDIENITSIGNESGNSSDLGSDKQYLKNFNNALLVTIMVIIMMSMGSAITWTEIWVHVRRPVGVAIGMLCQFVVMPLLGYILKSVFAIKGLFAVGIIIVSCSPGGAVSNTFTYFMDGDVALSVTMTTFSTIAALGMMPINLLIYGPSVEAESLKIPYDKMALSIVTVTSPVLAGMVIRWLFPKVAHYITKVGSFIGFALIGISMIIEVILYPNMIVSIQRNLYFLVTVMPLLGLLCGYCIAWICRREIPVRKTIAIESGIQNIGVALTVISLSFSAESLEGLLTFPVIYGIFMIGMLFVLCAVYQVYKRFCHVPEEEKEKDLVTGSQEEKEKDPVILVSYIGKDDVNKKKPT